MSKMAFFEQLGKRLTDAGQNVAQQTKNLADVTQLNSAISDREKKISQLYLSIGQQYYESHKGDLSAEHRELINEINTLQAENEQNREKIKQIKGVVKCPHCGADVPLNAAFCSICGTKMIQSVPPATVKYTPSKLSISNTAIGIGFSSIGSPVAIFISTVFPLMVNSIG